MSLVVIILQKSFYDLKKVLYDKNTFFSVQLLFSWVFFKLLGFLRAPLDLRFFAFFVSFLILFYCWRFLIRYILNNALFQVFLYFCYHLLNLLVKYNNGLFYFAFFCSFYLSTYLSEIDGFYLNEQKFLVPGVTTSFIFFFLYNFVRKFTIHIIFKFVERGFFYSLNEKNCLSWKVLIGIIRQFFFLSLDIKNKITLFNLKTLALEDYPIPSKMLLEFSKPENSLQTDLNERLMGQRILTIEELDEHFEYGLNRANLGKRLYKELHFLNDVYFFQFVYGLLCGFFLSFLLLNLNIIY